MSLSYPEIHEIAIVSHFTKEMEDFVHYTLIPALMEDKASRKRRVLFDSNCVRNVLTPEQKTFLETQTPLEDLTPVHNSILGMQMLKHDDDLFVEKMYHMLNELHSWAKGEGNKEVIRFLEENPHVHAEVRTYRIDKFKGTHVSQDLKLAAFKRDEHAKWRAAIITYCATYRKECYARFASLKREEMEKPLG